MGFFSYSQSYRSPEDWRGRLMPMDVFMLGVACWRAAYNELSMISQACPPTGCQALVYQTAFNSSIGRHRDNGLRIANKQARLGHSEDENSQVRGSSVIVFTEGSPMEFALVKPPHGKFPWNTPKKDYVFDTRLVVP